MSPDDRSTGEPVAPQTSADGEKDSGVTRGVGRPKKGPPPLLSADQAADLRRLLQERLKRKVDGLQLYRPMPLQRDFHSSNAREKLIRGSNRSGKTTAAAVEFARAVTGLDPRYPKDNGIAYLVGKDGKEVANVMYKLAFRAGAFKIIRDEASGEWRSFNPSSPLDAGRVKQARPAPPLIPPRLIKSIAWENKKANLPNLITLHNGWEIHLFSSNAKPPHGSQIDLAWFDEEIISPDWYPEVSARLVDRNGRFLWSATPQAGTVQLYELHERAEKEALLPKEQRRIEEFLALLYDNVHLTAQQKADFESKLSADEVMVRIHGEFASHGLRVFPEFQEKTHVCAYFDIPPTWTRYVAIDPGRQICAALFLAIPPLDEGDYAYLYDELYLAQCSAALFGQKMKERLAGYQAEAFIIDHQEGRKTETGSGRSVEEQYSDALRDNGVACYRSGCEFTWGSPTPEAGVEAVRSWIRPRSSAPPKLRVLADRCPNFIWEMKRYWYEKDRDGRVTDKPRSRGPVHLCACMRYLVQDEPAYVPPKESKQRASPVWLAARNLMKPKGKGSNTLNFGPGSTTFTLGDWQ